jgi:predicted transcriptional regulator
MTDNPTRADKAFLDEVRLSRDALREQIERSRATIERSMELLKQMDEIIAKAAKTA